MLARSLRAPLAVAGFACCALTTFAAADDFSDYRIPTHSAFSWTGDLAGNARRYTRDYAPDRTRQDAIRGLGQTEVLRWTDADAGFWSLDAGLALDGQRTREDRTLLSLTPPIARSLDSRASARLAQVQWTVGGTRSFYPEALPGFVRGDLRVLGYQTHRWSRSRTTDLETSGASTADEWFESNDRLRLVQTEAFATVTAGIGRVRDATSVYLARVLEHRLRAAGALSRDLSHAARQRLVILLAVSNGLDDLRSRPAKQAWGEIARIVADDGALAGGALDPAAVQRAGESLLEALATGSTRTGLPNPVVIRYVGHGAGVFVRGSHGRSSYFSEAGSRSQLTLDGVPGPVVSYFASSNAASGTDAAHLGVTVEWHRPVGLRLQLDTQASAAVPIRRQDDGSTLGADAAATWLVADRWWVRGRMNHQRTVVQLAESGRTLTDGWGLACELDLAYELEDRSTLRLTISDGQQRAYVSGGPSNASGGQHAYARDQYVTLGVTYRFAGRFSAPGFAALSEPVRVTPGP